MVEAQRAIESCWRQGAPCQFPALNDRHPEGPRSQQGGRLSLSLGSGFPNPQHCGARALGSGPSAGDLGFVHVRPQ